ncbi:DUF3606 domain-containing protein [Mesorhizobium sp. WSM2239]|uniref:DUF3606 domain-containing protein n=2 Tax=unclassified Mesorhizobium TaxID=325217 RepID=A0AAU8DG07_9HYPH
MADNKSKRGKQDRDRVASNQVRGHHFRRKHDITLEGAHKILDKHTMRDDANKAALKLKKRT